MMHGASTTSQPHLGDMWKVGPQLLRRPPQAGRRSRRRLPWRLLLQVHHHEICVRNARQEASALCQAAAQVDSHQAGTQGLAAGLHRRLQQRQELWRHRFHAGCAGDQPLLRQCHWVLLYGPQEGLWKRGLLLLLHAKR